MSKGEDSVPREMSAGFNRLLTTSGTLSFTSPSQNQDVDTQGRGQVEIDREFPFHVRLHFHTKTAPPQTPVWHERLELMIPLDHPVRFAMGNKVVDLNPGDLLMVDNLQLHRPMDSPAEDTRIIVLSFLPEFVYSLGSPSHDYLLLLPFYSKRTEDTLILQAQAAESDDACLALARLLECYFGAADRPFYRAGCKAYLLELLYHLARHFRQFGPMKQEFERQRERAHKLQGLLEHISQHYPEPYTVEGAARFANLSPSQFMRAFKKVAGMTLIAYVNHVRLSNAARLLRETRLSIAEIAAQTGFADQSYFDKRFKASFGVSPTEYRQGL